MGGGLARATGGFCVLTQVQPAAGQGGFGALVLGCCLIYVGLGPVFTLGTDLIIGAAPPERAGAAAAISETSSELGGALGIAVLGSIGTALYRGAMGGATLEGVPAEAARAARETLGGAAAAADRLPDGASADLLEAARDAFTHSLQTTASICAAVAAVTGLVALVTLRRIRAGAAASAPASAPATAQASSVVSDPVPVDVAVVAP
jgi:DHA2 family multidrug resistance protein-like MFS transporter